MRKNEYSPRRRSIVETNQSCDFKLPICPALPQLLSQDRETTSHSFHVTTFKTRNSQTNGREWILRPKSSIFIPSVDHQTMRRST